MFKKAQLKFVCIVMSILFAVFGVILMAVYYFSYNQTLSSIEHTIDQTMTSFYMPNGIGTQSDTIIAVINQNPTDINSDIRKLSIDTNVFSREQALEIIDTAINKNQKSGHIGNVYYKIYSNPSNPTILFIALDSTDSIALFSQNSSRAFFTLLIIYLLLFFVVMKLSWTALKPLRESFEKQKQFVANASHELKTPISIISANADVLNGENNNVWVDNIKSQTERMSVLIEDMLSLAQIDENKLKIKKEKFDISQAVLETALSFDAVAFEKGKTLNVDVAPDIIYNGDIACIKQLTNILLDNAIKHASEKGEISLKLEKEANKLVLEVFNTGSNIPEEDADKIFERFYRGDSSRSRESGGSGLGLSIAKNLANANKWEIKAISKPNQSMTIRVIL